MDYVVSRQRRICGRTFHFPLATYWILGDDSDGRIRRAIDADHGLLTLGQRLNDLLHLRTASHNQKLLSDGAICVWSRSESGVQPDERARIYDSLLDTAADAACPRPPALKEHDFGSFFRYAYANTKARRQNEELRARMKDNLRVSGKAIIDECLGNTILVELNAELCSAQLTHEHDRLLRQEFQESIADYSRRLVEANQEHSVVEQSKRSLVQSEQKIIDHLMERSDIELQAQRIAGLISRSRSFRRPFSD